MLQMRKELIINNIVKAIRTNKETPEIIDSIWPELFIPRLNVSIQDQFDICIITDRITLFVHKPNNVDTILTINVLFSAQECTLSVIVPSNVRWIKQTEGYTHSSEQECTIQYGGRVKQFIMPYNNMQRVLDQFTQWMDEYVANNYQLPALY
jgi:hypothetical protein